MSLKPPLHTSHLFFTGAISINNTSKEDLALVETSLEHGEFVEEPPETIKSGEIVEFGSGGFIFCFFFLTKV